MPEGDTIHRAAARLRPALEGRRVERIDAPRATGRPPSPGVLIQGVEAVGKHLLVRFDDGTVLRTHMRMSGSWHLYRKGDRWRRPAPTARVVLDAGEWVAVCFAAPVVVFERGDGVGHLGPDLARPDADLDAALVAMGAVPHPSAEIADVLLDQRVACGVGNVFKSEVLFACGVDPFVPLADVDPATRRALLATAARMLRANATAAGPRRTSPAGLSVYGRAGRPCRRCGTLVQTRRQGPHARPTFWCPTCQPPHPEC